MKRDFKKAAEKMSNVLAITALASMAAIAGYDLLFIFSDVDWNSPILSQNSLPTHGQLAWTILYTFFGSACTATGLNIYSKVSTHETNILDNDTPILIDHKTAGSNSKKHRFSSNPYAPPRNV